MTKSGLRSWQGQTWLRLLIGLTVVVAALIIAALVADSSASKLPALIVVLIVGTAAAVVVTLSRRDATSLLTVMLIGLFLIPESYVIAGPLRSVGNPALLAGLACLVVWLVGRWTGALHAEASHPFRWTIWLFFAAGLTAFAAALTRTLVSAESDSATRTVFPFLAMIGIAMVAADGLTSTEQVQRLLRRYVLLCTAEAAIGALEFFVKLDYQSLARLPGLTVNTEVTVSMRSGFDRIQAAAAHPIEFSVAVAAAAPLAIHFALNARSGSERRRFWGCVGLLVGVVPLTVSRSGLLALAVGVLVYGAVLKGRARANLLVFSAFGLLAFPVVAPGILGTVQSFVFAGTNDNSITGRLDDFAQIPGLMEGHLWFGRGFGTFDPDTYFFLDNQYLMELLTKGVIGLLALVGVFVMGASVARGARKRFLRSADGDFAQAVAAGILAIAVTAGTFDLFSFYQAAMSAFMLGGSAAALWTLARAEEGETSATTEAKPVLAEVTAGGPTT